MRISSIIHQGIVLLTAVVIFAACENNMKDLPSPNRRTGVEEATTVVSYYSRDARVRAKLTAPFMVRNLTDTPYTEFPKTLHVDFYNDSLRVESQMDALYGDYKEWQNKVT